MTPSETPTLYSRPTTGQYGLTALPAALPTSTSASPPPTFHASDFPVPNTPLARRIDAYVKQQLPPQTYRHSRRVFAWGCAVARGIFSGGNGEGERDWGRGLVVDNQDGSLVESWFLTAMLHDIGTVPSTLRSTRLSYEFWAGFHALQILQDASLTATTATTTSATATASASRPIDTDASTVAPVEQAESVAEAIIRHQDVQDAGQVTLLTRLIHIGTLLDNVGKGVEWISEETLRDVVREWPRVAKEEEEGEEKGRSVWTGCFRSTVEMEKREKPYAMVSRIEGFEEMIERNGRRGGGEGAGEGGAFGRFE